MVTLVDACSHSVQNFCLPIIYTVHRLRADSASPLLTGVLCSHVQRAMLPDTVRIQFVLLKMGMLMLETCRG